MSPHPFSTGSNKNTPSLFGKHPFLHAPYKDQIGKQGATVYAAVPLHRGGTGMVAPIHYFGVGHVNTNGKFVMASTYGLLTSFPSTGYPSA